MNVYFDNAATTPIDPEVLKEMTNVLGRTFGNPSSIHSYGREAKALVEKARKAIAGYINASPSEIFFTASGTESDNMAIRSTIDSYNIKHVISSPLEHHAVLHSIEEMVKEGKIKASMVKIKKDGHVDLNDLEMLLKSNPRSLVSLMHANNEIGNLLPLQQVSELCARYDALFHCDTVQSMCHYPIDLQKTKIHFIAGTAHKFHGPKGSGFIYINGDLSIHPLIYGGAQERNMRGGTENVAGIVALAKAMEVAYANMKAEAEHIQEIKNYMIHQLEKNIPGVEFNGDAKGNSLYTVLSVLFPPTEDAEMLLMRLDIDGIACSAGSACTSGSLKGSHVIETLGIDTSTRPVIRFSFSKYNTKEEVDYCVNKLVLFFKQTVTA